MALTRIIGGPRDGDEILCRCVDECTCATFGHGSAGGNKILDGYIEWLMYRKENGAWVPDHVERETMVVTWCCPRCDRPMPDGAVNCKNCGAEMNPLDTEDD